MLSVATFTPTPIIYQRLSIVRLPVSHSIMYPLSSVYLLSASYLSISSISYHVLLSIIYCLSIIYLSSVMYVFSVIHHLSICVAHKALLTGWAGLLF